MGQLLHGSARTTAAVRRALHQSQESLAKLAKRDDGTPKTGAQGKQRSHLPAAPMGPKQGHSTGLTLAEEAVIVAVRRPTLLPLADCLSALQAILPQLTRSALQRGLQRQGISRLPERAGEQPGKKRLKADPLGSFQSAIAEVRTEEGKLSLVGALDRACQLADAERQAEANNLVAAQVLRHLMAAIPDQIHTVRTAKGIQFTTRKRELYALQQSFDRVCHEKGREHRLPTPTQPWTHGQVERMNRTRKDATVNKSADETHAHLQEQLQAVLMAYNGAKRLKPLKGLTPYEDICTGWQQEPERLTVNPCHHTLGLNS